MTDNKDHVYVWLYSEQILAPKSSGKKVKPNINEI